MDDRAEQQASGQQAREQAVLMEDGMEQQARKDAAWMDGRAEQ